MKEEIKAYWEAGYPGLYLLTSEETRAERTLQEIVTEKQQDNPAPEQPRLYRWSLTTGWTHPSNQPVSTGQGDTTDPVEALNAMAKFPTETIAVLKDFHPFLEVPIVLRKLREIMRLYKASYRRMAILLSPVMKLPEEIKRELTVVEFALPTREDLGEVLDGLCTANKITTPENGARERIVEAGMGMTTDEFENALSQLWQAKQSFTTDGIGIVYREKSQVIKKSGALECILDSGESLDTVGGYDLYKSFVEGLCMASQKEARKFGLQNPKGVLLVGPPGVGKSLCAKATMTVMGWPGLRLDCGALFGQYVGQSEQQTRDALKTAEAMAPCVLWIDEVEKGIGTASAMGLTDSGTSSRVVATILTWLQEKTAPVIVVATANEIQRIPDALMRVGRFNAIFWCELPTVGERADILKIHLLKKNRWPLPGQSMANSEKLLRDLASSAEGFSGAELAGAVEEGLMQAFRERVKGKHPKRDLEVGDIRAALAAIVPLSRRSPESMEASRKWAQGFARPVSTEAELAKQMPTGSERKLRRGEG
jgi:SpoVK/Ycf46/Vps4 family AAA+-type ATPase